MRKIGIVGIGHVGATVAHIIIAQGLTDELILVDKNTAKLVADELDFRDAASLLRNHDTVYAALLMIWQMQILSFQRLDILT